MKRLIQLCVSLAIGTVGVRAEPTDTALVAMMRLSEQPSYSWVASVTDDARTYDIVGRTMRGYTQVKMPVINRLRRQLGRSVTDTEIELIYRGNIDCVVETESGWQRPDELPAPAGSAGVPSPSAGIAVPTVRGSRGAIHSGGRKPADPEPRAYSNLQMGLSHPHEELGILVSSHERLELDNGVVSGSLTDLGARLLLVRDGQDNIEPLRATGTFRVWLHHGSVAKYQVTLEGVLQVQLPTGARQIKVQQVTDTVIKDVGTTRFEIPPPARAKLEERAARAAR